MIVGFVTQPSDAMSASQVVIFGSVMYGFAPPPPLNGCSDVVAATAPRADRAMAECEMSPLLVHYRAGLLNVQ